MHTLSELHALLTDAPTAKREKLSALISSTFGADPTHICDHFLYLRYGALGQIGARSSYKQIVTDVADEIEIDWSAIPGRADWEALRTEVIEEHIARRLYAGAKKLPEALTVSIRPIRGFVRSALAEFLTKATPVPSSFANWAAERFAERLAGVSFSLSPEWDSLLAGVMFVHTELR